MYGGMCTHSKANAHGSGPVNGGINKKRPTLVAELTFAALAAEPGVCRSGEAHLSVMELNLPSCSKAFEALRSWVKIEARVSRLFIRW